jgi:hypothetical protein
MQAAFAWAHYTTVRTGLQCLTHFHARALKYFAIRIAKNTLRVPTRYKRSFSSQSADAIIQLPHSGDKAKFATVWLPSESHNMDRMSGEQSMVSHTYDPRVLRFVPSACTSVIMPNKAIHPVAIIRQCRLVGVPIARF